MPMPHGLMALTQQGHALQVSDGSGTRPSATYGQERRKWLLAGTSFEMRAGYPLNETSSASQNPSTLLTSRSSGHKFHAESHIFAV